ncbi:uncharacterized protein E0L32_010505 [Thyridium curvatum]|uniref:Carboxymuconolactone decarboxylase n=1 Tax=Thyridium curvatum TaxID=1093900 RepID=A0A507ASG0_9PEZI|nr:uncharacterized protein E0L32_010505 [Thyridium curvatum]TPX07818.1 hypothetical protein E0L32_010505 [Thyridium curvatum]
MTTADSDSQQGLLTQLFEKAEAEFPPRFREHGWYLTVIASLIGSGQQKLVGRLYEHLVAQPQYQTSAARQALVRRMREAMVKCIIINGIPSVIEAVTSVADVEKPEDCDYSCSREDWQVGPETSERAANVLKVLYKSEKGGHVKTLQSHRDIPWISVNISYGLFLSDHRILNIQETELVVLPAIMAQNLRAPTYWHLRACLRVGIEAEEVEAVQKIIEAIAAHGGRTLDVQRVRDVTDA